MRGTHRLQATGTFCFAVALRYPIPPLLCPQPAPVRACGKATNGLWCTSLEAPVFSHAPSPLFGASPARMQAPFLHLALASRALQPASQRRVPVRRPPQCKPQCTMHVSAASRTIRGASRKCAGWACAVHSARASRRLDFFFDGRDLR